MRVDSKVALITGVVVATYGQIDVLVNAAGIEGDLSKGSAALASVQGDG